MSDDIPDEIKAIAEDARADFDLEGRLRGRKGRETVIKVYTDETTGDLLGDARVLEEKNVLGIITNTEVIREGVLGRLAELGEAENDDAETAALRASLEAERDSLIEKLNETALTITLRSLPPIVIEDTKRQAKAALEIKGKVPEAREEEFERSRLFHMLASAITSIEDHETGGVRTTVTPRDAEMIANYLPQSEWVRLHSKMNEVLFKSAVAESVTAQASF